MVNPATVLAWPIRPRSSWKRDALFMAGTAGAALAIGAMWKGKKGAAIGAICGGVSRLIYRIAAPSRDSGAANAGI